MSDPYDDVLEEEEHDSGVPALRKHAKKLERELAEAREARETAEREAKRLRQETLIDRVLLSKGLSEKAIRLAKRDLIDQDVDEETVSRWLEENAEVFGVQVQPAASDEVEQSARIASASEGGKPPVVTTPGEYARKMNEATSKEEVLALAKEAGLHVAD